ncbi:uncharacterized protein LACBIDRAFT_312885 [Laccaria bicolor S238N-H82]|uniref:Predicted protein n=1 Tax=Laccaria bicolor (strain S238N-H82 / ATCC MYA-4686) TaxID=486041 RepID=B0DX16_LACBS|nr:uncharacterized protein LACBIDRAFT_312885 [Laccaria bicolor S238N-H82]EDR00910.1 predicted protein [Laccaria bicolor S238N-H82]|eukprot:XP_001888504.1 predicted protein [Laccaria bicolor S238N-H82]
MTSRIQELSFLGQMTCVPVFGVRTRSRDIGWTRGFVRPCSLLRASQCGTRFFVHPLPPEPQKHGPHMSLLR